MGRVRYSIIICMLILAVYPAAAWTKSRDFEGGLIGQEAQGSMGFDDAGGLTLYSNEVVNSGQRSAKFIWNKGDTGFVNCRGEHYYVSEVGEGQELWIRAYYYFKSPWSWTAAPFNKIMRIHVRNTAYLSVLSDAWGQIVGNSEVVDRNYYSGRTFDTDRWQSIEMYVKISGSQGILRVWKDGVLIIEDKTSATTRNGNNAIFSYFMSYWNGGCPENQVMYMDDVVMTTDMPSARDAAGNPMIGPIGWSGGGSGPVCGKNGCESGETCSNCPADCGACPCTPNWQCTAWSSCVNSQQTRTCTDANNCGTTSGKPATTQSCTSSQITFDSTNPIIYDNDECIDVYTDDYIMALASAGSIQLKGIITTSSFAPFNPYIDSAGWDKIHNDRLTGVNKARQSGFKNIPDPVRGVKGNLNKPSSGKIEDTATIGSAGSWLIVNEARKATPSKPLLVLCGGPVSTVADAYLLAPDIADKIIVAYVGGDGINDYNSWTDPWALYIALNRLKMIQFPLPMDQAAPSVPKSRLYELPDTPLREWMISKYLATNGLPSEHDGDGQPAVTIMRNDFIVSRDKHQFASWVMTQWAPNNHEVVTYKSGGSTEYVTSANKQVATDEWWRAMKNPLAWGTCTSGQTQSCNTGLQGICSAGTMTCSNGKWGGCVQSNSPKAEICGNGIDEDCDGADLPCSGSTTIITVDSTYSGYSTSVIDDGNTDAFGGTSTTWASEESSQAHWILFTFPAAKELSKVDVYWAYNPVQQKYMSSQELQVQYWDGSKYVTAATITNSDSVAKSTASFSKISTARLRLYQPAGKGAAVYPSVIWIAEVDYGATGGNCAHESDIDCDGSIRQDELLQYITRWKSGQVSLAKLIEVIRIWKT